MKHIRQFESFRTKLKRDEIIKESVMQVDDIYKVRTTIDIPQSLINAYVKKVKEKTGKNLRQFFGDVDIAEEIVKYITRTSLDSEKIPASALVGGAQQGQQQGQQVQQGPAQTQQQDEQDYEQDEQEEQQGQQQQSQQQQSQQQQSQQQKSQQDQEEEEEDDEDYEDVDQQKDQQDEEELPEEE